jgi:hypothetical protein
LAEGKNFDVVRVVCDAARSVRGVREGEAGSDAEEDLMGDPIKVFALRLDREPGLEAGERADLELVFREVWNRYQEEGEE